MHTMDTHMNYLHEHIMIYVIYKMCKTTSIKIITTVLVIAVTRN